MKKAIIVLLIIIGVLVLAIGGFLLGDAIGNREAGDNGGLSFAHDKSDKDDEDEDEASQTRRSETSSKTDSDESAPTEESEIAFDPSESEEEERRRQEEEEARLEESRRQEESSQLEEESRQRAEEERRREEEEEARLEESRRQEESSQLEEESRRREEEESRQREDEDARRARAEELAAKALAAYKTLLEDVCNNPNDYVEYYEPDKAADAMQYNTFSFYDIDRDGVDELILIFTNTYVAAMKSLIYTYDDAEDTAVPFTEEYLSAYIKFYEGGYCTMAASHNHTYGNLYPYSLFRWSNVEKTFVPLYSFYSCNKDYDQNGTYDEDVDIDGDGEIYFIYDEAAGEATAVDNEEYESFVQQYIPDDTWLDLTRWSIRPDVVEDIETIYQGGTL